MIFISAEVSMCFVRWGKINKLHLTQKSVSSQKTSFALKFGEGSNSPDKEKGGDSIFFSTQKLHLCLLSVLSLCGPETVHWLTSSEKRSVKLSVDYFSLISIYKSPVIHYLHSYLAVIFVGQRWLNLSRGLIDRVRSSLSTLLKLKTNVSALFMGRSAVKLARLVITDRSGMF